MKQRLLSNTVNTISRLTVLLLLVFTSAGAQTKTPYVVPRFEGVFQLDGVPDEPGWKALPALPATMHIPTVGAEPTERTEFRIAYDDAFLYVAGWLYDSNPAGIQSLSFKRDELSASDWFGIGLDTFADRENALAFYTSPAANRCDYSNKNDAQGDDWISPSWNTFWYCATSRNAEGWFAEFKIPLSSLRYQDVNGRVTMGLNMNRRIARKNEYITYPAISNQWGFTSQFKPSQMQPIVFENLTPRKPVYITPYLLTGVSSQPQLNDAHTAYTIQHLPTYNAGLDMKFGLTSNLTADLTINTDFAQVEADDQQVNLTRFNLFFPEKRLFFQEQASIFTFSFGGTNQLFYSRRIGLNNGQQVPILAGARVVGRVGQWDVGALAMQTRPTGDLSAETMNVVRLRRRVFNQNSYVGLMTTTRIGADGQSNLAYGLDAILRLYQQNFLSINWAQTFDHAASTFADSSRQMNSFFDLARWQVRYEKRTLNGLGYDLSIARAGRSYVPGLGFESRQDYTRFGDRLFWGWLPGQPSSLLNHQVSVYGYAILRNDDGRAESVEVSPAWDGLFKKGHSVQVKFRNAYERLLHPLLLADNVQIPAGPYHFRSIYGLLTTPFSQPLSARFEAEAGGFYNGSQVSVGLSPVWAVSRYLELSSSVQWNRISLPTHPSATDVLVGQLRTKVSVNVRVSAEALVQYNSVARLMASNIRFRYNPREGNDLYIVFNQGTHTGDLSNGLLSTEVLPFRLNNRTLVLKYTCTFVR